MKGTKEIIKMRILAICGSMRKGNTEFILKNILKDCKGKAQTRLILLKEKNIQFCRSCDDICSQSGKCVIEDDMKDILKEMADSDIIIFGSPTYYDNVSGLMKNFMDRIDPLSFEKQLKDKQAYVITVGVNLESAKKSAEILRNFCHIHKMKIIGSSSFKAYKKKDSDNPEIKQMLKKISLRCISMFPFR